MTDKIDVVKKVRLFLLDIIKDLSAEQLNKIPEGFFNNIIWNLGHLVAAQQGICYVRTGLQPKVDAAFFDAYKSGSRPAGTVDEAAIGDIKNLMFTTLDAFLADYEKNIFTNYTAWTTRYKVELTSIEEAIDFLLYHEGLHAGVITAMVKLV